MNLNDVERLQLQKMISENQVTDQTELIRKLKHSHVLRDNVNQLIAIKAKVAMQPDLSTDEERDQAIQMEAMTECSFLYMYYTDIYNRVKKDEIDLSLLYKAFDVLRDIEDGRLDQHTGAYTFGQLLKEIYIDSALKKADKMDAKYNKETGKATVPDLTKGTSTGEFSGAQEELTWVEYKRLEHLKLMRKIKQEADDVKQIVLEEVKQRLALVPRSDIVDHELNPENSKLTLEQNEKDRLAQLEQSDKNKLQDKLHNKIHQKKQIRSK